MSETECTPKTGWLSGETYCALHGRAAEWPCRDYQRRSIDDVTRPTTTPVPAAARDTTTRPDRAASGESA